LKQLKDTPRTEEDISTCNAEFKRKLFLVMIPPVNANNMHYLIIHHTLNRSFVILIVSFYIKEISSFDSHCRNCRMLVG
jgi:hypothetical protein